MNRVRRLAATIGFCAVLALSDLAAVGAQAAVPEYTARVVARLQYGLDPSQIYINWGPLSDRVSGPLAALPFTMGGTHAPYSLRAFAVDAPGSIYVSSYTQEDKQVIKKSTAAYAAQLTESLAMYTEPTDSFPAFVVSPEGAIFTSDDEHAISRLGPDGRRLWSRGSREVLDFFGESPWARDYTVQWPPAVSHAIRGPFAICSVSTSRRDGATPGIGYRFGVVLDENGDFVTVLPTDQVAPDGSIYRGSPQYDPEGKLTKFTFRFFDPDGAVIHEIMPEVELEGHDLFEHSPWAVTSSFIDAAGYLVVPYFAKTLPDRFPYGSILEAYTQFNFNRYDGEGRFLEGWSFPGSPLEDLTHSTIIGHDGNFYHLAFDDTGVDVIQYAPAPGYAVRPGGGPQVTHLVAFRRGDTLYTRLRDVASRSGAEVAWVAQDSAALVRKADRSLRLRPGSDVALDGSGEAVSLGAPVELRQGRLWVPAIRLAALLDLPLYTDKAQRVAYLITHPSR